MILGIDPKVDYAFKHVFGDQHNAEILIHLINAVLQPPEPIVRIDILNPFHEKDFVKDKLTVVDIKARDQAQRLLNIEMQLLLPRDFRGRILYYQAGLYREQLGEGEPYFQLRPVITICLVNQMLFPQVEDYHLEFRWLDERYGLRFSDDMEIHLLELVKFGHSLDELAGPLEKWMYFFRHGADLDEDNLPEALDEHVYRRAARELAMLTKNEQERERYEARQRAIRDQLSYAQEAKEARERGLAEGLAEGRAEGLARGRDEGLAQGRAGGLAEGRVQGELIGRMHLCERLLGMTLTPTEELANLSIDDLRRRVADVESRVVR
jgi:predicted transposase/invertase (TIGR01784 family)